MAGKSSSSFFGPAIAESMAGMFSGAVTMVVALSMGTLLANLAYCGVFFTDHFAIALVTLPVASLVVVVTSLYHGWGIVYVPVLLWIMYWIFTRDAPRLLAGSVITVLHMTATLGVGFSRSFPGTAVRNDGDSVAICYGIIYFIFIIIIVVWWYRRAQLRRRNMRECRKFRAEHEACRPEGMPPQYYARRAPLAPPHGSSKYKP